jgi:Zn-dependent oligopeptidase
MSAAQQVPFDIPMRDPALTTVPEEAIRERAYELYERRGQHDGLDQPDWLQAESELRAEIRARQESRIPAELPE